MHACLERAGLAAAVVLFCAGQAAAQDAAARIEWEVANRFRLFAEQRDFDIQVNAYRALPTKNILELEHKLADKSVRGIGWAASVNRLCADTFTGRMLPRCQRDGVEEDYLKPQDIRIKLSVSLPADFGDAQCTWTIGSGEGAKTIADRNCRNSMTDQRVPPNKAVAVAVVARNAAGTSLEASATVEARDILIVGLGDSIASGEGNPTRPVALSDNGFCFRRVLTSQQRFYLPGRARAHVFAACPSPGESIDDREKWDAAGAEWLYTPCHRSLYSYQTRAALALAIENPTLSVTYYPLGCTGASIRQGMLGPQQPRERPRKGNQQTPRALAGQFEQLSRDLGMTGNNRAPSRLPDLILLTIGANDLKFAGLVADLIISEEPERGILARQHMIVGPREAARALAPLANDFRALRQALLRFTDGKLERVIFTNYGNPAMQNGDEPCPTTRRGFDGHPAFSIVGSRLAESAAFVEKEFLPGLKTYATCGADAGCTNPDRDRMTYVDGHSEAFRHHGFCVVDDHDPAFDRECFRDGGSFNNDANGGLNTPMSCRKTPANFRAYAKRARWVRTPNDSYFTAMTYPTMGAFTRPADIHDGLWGVASVVYGGAMHPTAEGHAAMADAALPAARRLLGLPEAPPLAAAARMEEPANTEDSSDMLE